MVLRRHRAVSRATLKDMDAVGICSVCGHGIESRAAVINTGPTELSDPATLPVSRRAPVGTEIQGWSSFVLTYPVCRAREHSVEDLIALVDDSHRLLRAELAR